MPGWGTALVIFTGFTLGYLLPAIAHRIRHGKQSRRDGRP